MLIMRGLRSLKSSKVKLNFLSDELLFLNLNSHASINEIKQAFEKSKCYLWLCELIKNSENQELYFGAVTASLYNVLLNEPKPYRSDVKILLSNLLNWITELQVTELKIDRPNHSQRVKYNSE